MEEKTKEGLLRENEELKERLREAEEVLRAIRQGEVDALAVSDAEGERIYTLAGANQVYRVLMDSMNEGALTLSQDGTILYGNRRFEQMSGVAPTKLIGSSITDFIPLEDRKNFEALIENARNEGRARGELQILGANEESFPAGLSINAVELDRSEAFCIIVSDLTELRAYTRRLEALNRDLSEFIFVASHDLQEPLRKIQTFCSRVVAPSSSVPLDKEMRDNLERMQKSAKRMQGLLHALTSYSLASGRPELFEVIDLRDIAHRAELELSGPIREKGAQIHILDLPPIEAAPSQMRRLFKNLIENALKFHGNESPRVKIYGEVSGTTARIFVEDNGIGLDERFLDRIFKPFQQLHGRNQFEGTGMGLAICRKIVERHKGTLAVASSSGPGSKFVITLPLRQTSQMGFPNDTLREKANEELLLEIYRLRDAIRESNEIISAIRQGKVDALVSHEPEGEKVYTLKSADRGYRLLVECIGEGALILTQEGSIFYANHRFEEMLGRPPGKITGSFFIEHVHADDQRTFETILNRLGARGDAKGEIRLEAAGGAILPVHVSFNPLQMEEFDGICATVTDLTQQKRVMERLERSNRELQDFASIASHDLQEPLRKIVAFGDRLKAKYTASLGAEGCDYLNRMQSASKRMQAFINDLLRYSRLTTHGERLDSLNLNELLGETLNDLQMRIDETGGTFEIGELPSLEADPCQMRQLFQNLIGNALKFHGEKKPLVRIHGEVVPAREETCTLGSHPGNYCQITIEDNGIGFDESYSERIFAPFQRLQGRSAFEGSGLGLAICQKIVERHGGTITARSTPGEGSTFIVTLPLKQSQAGGS